MSEQKSFFQKLAEKYNQLCKDLGVEQGGCRGCVPVVKFDETSENSEPNKEKQQ